MSTELGRPHPPDAAASDPTSPEETTAVDAQSLVAGDIGGGRPTAVGSSLVRRVWGNKMALIAAGVLLALALIALLAPWIAPYPPNEINVAARMQPPSLTHLFGTDDVGRDLLSRVIFGARLSLGAATISVVLGAVLGVLPGLIAGLRGGGFDLISSRLVDAVMCIPGLILSISVIATLGPGIWQVAIAIGISFAPRFFRIARGASLAVASETYVKAARAAGARGPRLLFRHVLPNAIAPIVVQLSLMFGLGLIAEASLSFLGLGAQPPDASWGSLLRRGVSFMSEANYLSILPGLVIMVAVLAANLLGDSLQRQTRGVRKAKARA